MKVVRSIMILLGLMIFHLGSLAGQSGRGAGLPQFVFPEFVKGVVKMKSGDNYTAMLNYNVVDEEMIFVNKGSYMALENIGSVDTILMAGRRFVPAGKVFYEVIVNDKYPFFIQHKSKYTQEGTATAYGMTSQVNTRETYNNMTAGNQVRSLQMPDNVKVVHENVSWVRIDSELKKFSGERQFIKLFPAKENELKDFFKKNSIDFSRTEDLLKLARYCNEINR